MFSGMVRSNVTFLVCSISKFSISFSSLSPKFALYIIARTRSSFLLPRFIISTVYSACEPGVIIVGPVIFLMVTSLSSLISVILILLSSVSALRLVQIDSLFSSVSLA